jgi:ribonuclease P protein component
MRFRPEQHLRRQSEIRQVREQGRRVDCRAFTIWWKRRETPGVSENATAGSAIVATPAKTHAGGASSDPRVCVIASTAAVGHAVRRNRAKRRLREIFRAQQHLVPPGCDLLLIARAAATDRPLPELAQKFSDACGQIAASCPPVK